MDSSQSDLDLSPGTWQQVLDSFYGKDPFPVFESPERVLGTGTVENRPGLAPESIDLDAFKAFGRGL